MDTDFQTAMEHRKGIVPDTVNNKYELNADLLGKTTAGFTVPVSQTYTGNSTSYINAYGSDEKSCKNCTHKEVCKHKEHLESIVGTFKIKLADIEEFLGKEEAKKIESLLKCNVNIECTNFSPAPDYPFTITANKWDWNSITPVNKIEPYTVSLNVLGKNAKDAVNGIITE